MNCFYPMNPSHSLFILFADQILPTFIPSTPSFPSPSFPTPSSPSTPSWPSPHYRPSPQQRTNGGTTMVCSQSNAHCTCFRGRCDMNYCMHDCSCDGGRCSMKGCTYNCSCQGGICNGTSSTFAMVFSPTIAAIATGVFSILMA